MPLASSVLSFELRRAELSEAAIRSESLFAWDRGEGDVEREETDPSESEP